MRRVLPVIALVLSGCGGIAWNTTVADSPAVRAMMVQSVVPGQTTERAFATRWGHPTQKINEGAQTEFVYRNVVDPGSHQPIQHGDSVRYVIVTFQYGIATGARSSETEGCRATFSTRPPGAGFNTPTTVRPVRTCPGVLRPDAGTGVGADADLRSGASMTPMQGPPLPPHMRPMTAIVPSPVREDSFAAKSKVEPK